MHVDNFLRYIAKDQLIISPGDRSDILLAAIASRLSSAKPDIAGVLLTGGLRPPEEVCKLIEGWTGAPVPILLTEFHTYRTITALQDQYSAGPVRASCQRQGNRQPSGLQAQQPHDAHDV